MIAEFWEIRQEGESFAARERRSGCDGMGERVDKFTGMVKHGDTLEAVQTQLRAENLMLLWPSKTRNAPEGVLEVWTL